MKSKCSGVCRRSATIRVYPGEQGLPSNLVLQGGHDDGDHNREGNDEHGQNGNGGDDDDGDHDHEVNDDNDN